MENESSIAGTEMTEGESAIGSEGTQTTETVETGSQEGQPVTEQTEGESEVIEGVESTDETTVTNTETGGESTDTFFDPKDISNDPKLMAAYKQMQSAFSKKMDIVKADRTKIEAFDAIVSDPVNQLQAMAEHLGYKLESKALANSETTDPNWEPQTWEEAMGKMKSEARREIMNELAPVLNEFKTTKKKSVETFLDENAPDWRVYEDQMREKLKAHPSLRSDPMALYELSVPAEVREGLATQRALERMKKKSASNMSGKSKTKTKTGFQTDKAPTFQEAYEMAKRKLAEDGIRPPVSN